MKKVSDEFAELVELQLGWREVHEGQADDGHNEKMQVYQGITGLERLVEDCEKMLSSVFRNVWIYIDLDGEGLHSQYAVAATELRHKLAGELEAAGMFVYGSGMGADSMDISFRSRCPQDDVARAQEIARSYGLRIARAYDCGPSFAYDEESSSKLIFGSEPSTD